MGGPRDHIPGSGPERSNIMILANIFRVVRSVQATACTGAVIGFLATTTWAGAPQSDPNAALRYWRAFDMQNETVEHLVDAARAESWADGWRPDEGFLQDLASQRVMIDTLIEASLMEGCDFGVDYDKGFEALLPHLGMMRHGAMLLVLEARVLAENGDLDSAVDRARAVYAMSEHVTADRTLISSLVSLALFRLADEFVIPLAEEDLLTQAHRTTLSEALMRFDEKDPFAIKSSIESERDICLSWLRGLVIERGFDGALDYMENLVSSPGEDLSGELRSHIPDVKALDRQLAAYEEYYTLVLQVWDRPDAQDRIKDLEELYLEGKDGYIVGHLAVAAITVHKRYVEGGEHYREAMQRVGLTVPQQLNATIEDAEVVRTR